MLIYIIVTLVAEKSVKTLRGRLIGGALATGMLSGIVHVFSEAVESGDLKDQIAIPLQFRAAVL